MAEKILNTRIQLKYDTLANWNSSTITLKKGEVAIAEVSTWQIDETTLQKVAVPTCLMKVGDGTKTFSQLKWVAAQAADVYDWAKKSETEFIAWVKGLIDVNDIDLSAYYTAEEVDNLLNGKVDNATLGSYYTKTEADAAFTTPEEVIEEVNKAIGEIGDADTKSNIVELVEYANSNASDLTALITEVYGAAEMTGESRIDKAITDSASAVETANNASTTAGEAKATANTANTTAGEAKTLATEAKTAAETAQTSAAASASAAAASATAASTSETNAAASAAAASTSESNAATSAQDAATAKDDAVTAKNEAVTAKNDAVTAKDDAVIAKEAAVAAQGAAETAEANAETAQGKAEDAQAAAEAAQGKAETAQGAAEAALAKVTNAVTGAEAVATEAKTIAQGAAQDAAEAKADAADAVATANTAVQNVVGAENCGIKATKGDDNVVTIDWDDAVTLVFDCGDANNSPLNA